MKKKTYVLIVSRTFPKTHKRAGEQTWFVEKINEARMPITDEPIMGKKIHTIRANYELWNKRAKEINEGKAILSLRYWSGKPYNSPQVEFMQIEKIGLQRLEFYEDKDGIHALKYPLIDNYAEPNIETIAVNDGLLFVDFREWFKKYDISKTLAIIQFTNFKY
jgi:hypothetical protein